MEIIIFMLHAKTLLKECYKTADLSLLTVS